MSADCSWCPHLLTLSVVDERLELHCLAKGHALKKQPCWLCGGSMPLGAKQAFEPEASFSWVRQCTPAC